MNAQPRLESPAQAEAFIRPKYRELEYDLGWTYLYSPARTIGSPRLVTVGLNPAGRCRDEPYDQVWSCEDGNAYLAQRWGSEASPLTPLQQQIAKLFKLFAHIPPDEIASLQYVPFRSEDWRRIHRKDEALAVGDRLWDWLWRSWQANDALPDFVICFGKTIIADRIASRIHAREKLPYRTGWGKTTADVWAFGKQGRLIALPHLSRYRIFGRAEFALLPDMLGFVPSAT